MNKKKIIRKIIVFLLIILIFLLILFNVLSNIVEKKNIENKIKESKENLEKEKLEIYDEMMENMLMPTGIFQLKKNYKGQLDLDVFYKSIRSLGDDTVNIANRLNLETEENIETIENNLSKEYEFNNLKEYIEFLKNKKLNNVYNATINTSTLKTTSEGLNFEMTIGYNDDDENTLIKYDVLILNNLKNDNAIKYKYIIQ